MQRGETGQGYVYYRDRSRGHDVTVYEHQLMMLVDTDPALVFAPEWDVHHEAPHRAANVREFLDLVDAEEHRARGGDRYALRGKA